MSRSLCAKSFRLVGLLALCLAGSTSGCWGSSSGTLTSPAPAPSPPPEPGDPPPGGIVEETIALENPEDGEAFFPDDRFVQVEIEMPVESWEALSLEPYEWAPADVVLDGRRIEDVAIRLRGRIGSFREIGSKPKLRLDFNRYVPGRRVDGLEALSLDNNVVDCSGLKQMLGFHVLALAGVPGSRAGFGQVYINDVYYGVYNTIEPQDDRFLKRVFEDNSGTLYDGAYLWYGGWNYTMLDFYDSVDMLYDQEEGPDLGHADIRGVTDALAVAAYQPGFVAAMDAVWDMEAFYPYMAVEHWIGQNDGYVLNTNNNRIYFDPVDGRARMISYDLDYAFMPNPWEYTFDYPRGFLARACLDDPECRAGVVDAMAELLDVLDESDLAATYEAWEQSTWLEAVSDPKRSCSGGDISGSRSYLQNWIQNRGSQMSNYWGTP